MIFFILRCNYGYWFSLLPLIDCDVFSRGKEEPSDRQPALCFNQKSGGMKDQTRLFMVFLFWKLICAQMYQLRAFSSSYWPPHMTKEVPSRQQGTRGGYIQVLKEHSARVLLQPYTIPACHSLETHICVHSLYLWRVLVRNSQGLHESDVLCVKKTYTGEKISKLLKIWF